jgi:hypothetical protein
MKRVFFTIASLTLLFACQEHNLEQKVDKLQHTIDSISQSQAPTNVPVMTFEQSEYDFGEIEQGQVVNYVFKFKNTGKAPLVIENASASCGCTIPEWPHKPVNPGESGEIKVQFNSKGKVGIQNKAINISANTVPANSTVNIKGNVIVKNK